MAVTINGDGTISGINVGGLPDGSVDSDTLATGIDATKLADGTVTSAELQYINTLSSNAQTQIDGAGGAWVQLDSQAASDDASLDYTGITTTYGTYAIVLTHMMPATDGAIGAFRVGDSGGFDSGASDYEWVYQRQNPGSAGYEGSVDAADTYLVNFSPDVGSAAGEGISATLYLRTGANVGTVTMDGAYSGVNGANDLRGGTVWGHKLTAITCDRVQFLFTTGNVASGQMVIYGLTK